MASASARGKCEIKRGRSGDSARGDGLCLDDEAEASRDGERVGDALEEVPFRGLCGESCFESQLACALGLDDV